MSQHSTESFQSVSPAAAPLQQPQTATQSTFQSQIINDSCNSDGNLPDWLVADLGMGTTEKRAFASAYHSLKSAHPNEARPNEARPNDARPNEACQNEPPRQQQLQQQLRGPVPPMMMMPPSPHVIASQQPPFQQPQQQPMTLLSGQDNLNVALIKIGQLSANRLPQAAVPQAAAPATADGSLDALIKECQGLENFLWNQVFNVIQNELRFKQSPFFRNTLPPMNPPPMAMPPPPPPPGLIPPPPPGLAPFNKWMSNQVNESQANRPYQFTSYTNNQKQPTNNRCNPNMQKWA